MTYSLLKTDMVTFVPGVLERTRYQLTNNKQYVTCTSSSQSPHPELDDKIVDAHKRITAKRTQRSWEQKDQ